MVVAAHPDRLRRLAAHRGRHCFGVRLQDQVAGLAVLEPADVERRSEAMQERRGIHALRGKLPELDRGGDDGARVFVGLHLATQLAQQPGIDLVQREQLLDLVA